MVQRLFEVVIANRNKKWMEAQGAFEVGKEHYPFMVLMHIGFFFALIAEMVWKQPQLTSWAAVPFCLFIIAQMIRIWALTSLGRYWNTRIIVLPGAKVITKGPYQFMRHPNYVVVVIELLCLPLIFQAYWTALIFSSLNLLILSIRIKSEERALKADTNYQDVFEKRNRFIPRPSETE
ncbi:isoprenylcysteine carboxyl methyltransferase [Alkalihalobacillus pseudalcaliphilus]|nr:isoprenylcysteine carboxyl methyltransferase [Alkalihalobacillus pseudalcaliphilus]